MRDLKGAWRWLWLGMVVMLAGCSEVKQDLFDLAMQYERSMAGLSVRSLDVNGMPIEILESPKTSEAETLVLIHGFGANKENWVRFAGELTDHFYVVAVDMPGHGQSVKDPDLGYSLDEQVGYLRAIVGALGLERFHLAGNSMGGGISSLYAAAYPEQVQTLTLFDPAGIFEFESEFVRLVEQGKNPLVVNNKDDYDQLLDLVMVERPFMPWPILDVMAQQAVANKPLNEKIFADMKAKLLEETTAFQDRLALIQAPTLILWGKEDRVLDYRNADVFERLIPGSRKVILDHIGHVPMIEVPEQTAGLVREFVQLQAEAEIEAEAEAVVPLATSVGPGV